MKDIDNGYGVKYMNKQIAIRDSLRTENGQSFCIKIIKNSRYFALINSIINIFGIISRNIRSKT